MRSCITRVKVFFLVLSLILFKFNSFSQTKTESVVEPIKPIWQNLKADSELNKLKSGAFCPTAIFIMLIPLAVVTTNGQIGWLG